MKKNNKQQIKHKKSAATRWRARRGLPPGPGRSGRAPLPPGPSVWSIQSALTTTVTSRAVNRVISSRLRNEYYGVMNIRKKRRGIINSSNIMGIITNSKIILLILKK